MTKASARRGIGSVYKLMCKLYFNTVKDLDRFNHPPLETRGIKGELLNEIKVIYLKYTPSIPLHLKGEAFAYI